MGGFGDGIPEAGGRLAYWLRQVTLRRTALFVPWSHFTAERTEDVYPPAASRTVVIHPGVDLEKWPQRTPPPAHERFRLLFVGGDPVRKGLDTVLDAYDRGLRDACELDVVTSLAALPDGWRRRIDELPHVRVHDGLTPGAPELQRLYREADAFVLPTTLDMSSIASVEAMAMGIPVIVPDVGGVPDILIDGKTGLVVRPGEAPALQAAVERLRTDQALREALVLAARQHVETHFDLRKNGPALLASVKALVDERRMRGR